MRVRLSDIPFQGLPVKGTVPAASLNARLQEGSDRGFRFLEDPRVDLLVFKRPSGGEVKGKISGRYEQPCALCLKNIPREVSVDANFFLRSRPENLEDEPENAFEDDVGVYHYDGDHAELEEIIQELLILSLSVYWHPDLDENGKCSGCGKDLEEIGSVSEKAKPETQSFGDLLKKAGLKN